MLTINTTFGVSKDSKYNKASLKPVTGKNTIEEIAIAVNTLSWKEYYCQMLEKKEMLQTTKKLLYRYEHIVNELILEDKNKKTFQIKGHLFSPEKKDELLFVYGMVKEINYYTKSNAHILCEYVSNNHRFKLGNFVVSRNRIEEMDICCNSDYDIILLGLAKRITKTIPAKRSYNTYTHTSYTIRESQTKEINKLTSFSLLKVTKQGLYFETDNEKELYEDLYNRNIPFFKPSKELKNYGHKPSCIASINGQPVVIETTTDRETADDLTNKFKNLRNRGLRQEFIGFMEKEEISELMEINDS